MIRTVSRFFLVQTVCQGLLFELVSSLLSEANVADNLNEMELESENGEEEVEVDEELMNAMNNKNDHSKQTITYHTGKFTL